MGTRELIRDFNIAFGRPVNDELTPPSVSDRILLGKLILEECVETLTKGLGLTIHAKDVMNIRPDNFDVVHREGDLFDAVETIDGLADMNVVIHFMAHWMGMNLDRATEIVNESNMSKLGEDGKPIINGVTPGYRDAACLAELNIGEGFADDEEGFDPAKPVGKILKGPNYWDAQPKLRELIMMAGVNRDTRPLVHIDESTIKPSAALDHCADHPNQTTENCEGGYGLAGGGVGMYYICGTCGNVFGKTDDGEDF